MTREQSKECMSANRQRVGVTDGKKKEQKGRVMGGVCKKKLWRQLRDRQRGWGGEWREHATVKCISGNMHPVRWNWTRWENIVLGQAESESLGWLLLTRAEQLREKAGANLSQRHFTTYFVENTLWTIMIWRIFIKTTMLLSYSFCSLTTFYLTATYPAYYYHISIDCMHQTPIHIKNV